MIVKKFLNVISISDLQNGDIIRNKSGSESYIVTGNYGTHVTAVRTVDVTNPSEWEVLQPVSTFPIEDA